VTFDPSLEMATNQWFSNLVCPVSSERGRQDVVRLTALLVAALTIAYLVTRVVWIPVLLCADFAARGAGRRAWSPLARVAQAALARRRRPTVPIDLAPKQFAARVGLLFSLGMLATHAWSPSAALALGGILTVFALLEGAGNLCVGCLVYTHVMVPLVRRR
jgi:Domain of unknown function (DUF4395)